MFLVLLFCRKAALMHLVDLMTDWKEAGVEIALYGYTERAHDGFILMKWAQKPPERFIQKQLQEDPDILDYLVCPSPFEKVTAPA